MCFKEVRREHLFSAKGSDTALQGGYVQGQDLKGRGVQEVSQGDSWPSSGSTSIERSPDIRHQGKNGAVNGETGARQEQEVGHGPSGHSTQPWST